MSRILPLGWTSRRIDALATFVRGVSFKKDDARAECTPGYIAVLRAGNLQNGNVVWNDLVYVPEHLVSKSQRIAIGDIVVAMSSGSASVVGKAASIGPHDMSEPAGFGAFCGLWRPAALEHSRWLQEYFQSSEYRQTVSAAALGVNINNLRADHIGQLEIGVPPIAEQRRIVAKLESLQSRSRRAREALDAVPPLLEKLRQSILAAAFRGDLTKHWRAQNPNPEPASALLARIRTERRQKWEASELAKLKAKGKAPTNDGWKAKYRDPAPVDTAQLPELPEGWCWASIGELAHVGTGATPKRGESKYYAGGTVPWVTSGALNDELVTAATELVTDCAVAETNLTVYAPGTLLLAMYGEGKTRGMVAELGIEAATNQAIAAICLEGSAVAAKSLVRLALAQNYAHIRSVSMGGVQPNLNLEKVRDLAVPLCPVHEVNVLEGLVVEALARISQVADRAVAQRETLDKLNQSTLAKAFRGELVPQDPTDEPADAMLARLGTEAPVEGSRQRPRHTKAAE